jgi:hypothetical protein
MDATSLEKVGVAAMRLALNRRVPSDMRKIIVFPPDD